MNKKYQRYIEYIVSDIEAPYFKNMSDVYGLKDSEYEMILSRMFNQPVSIMGNQLVYDLMVIISILKIVMVIGLKENMIPMVI